MVSSSRQCGFSSAIRNALKSCLHDVTSRAPPSYHIMDPVHILHMDLQSNALYSNDFALRYTSSARDVLRRSVGETCVDYGDVDYGGVDPGVIICNDT